MKTVNVLGCIGDVSPFIDFLLRLMQSNRKETGGSYLVILRNSNCFATTYILQIIFSTPAEGLGPTSPTSVDPEIP